jgi:DNA-binding GntR family transcriptional regulator
MDPGIATGRAALADVLAADLKAKVLAGEFPAGTRLRQEDVAARFGVSRTPVREAFRKLQAGGLVELVPYRGAVVRGPRPRDVREAYEVRAALEGLAAELAAVRIEESGLRALREAEELFRRLLAALVDRRRDSSGDGELARSDIADWARANDLFHQAIHEAAGNDRLRLTIAELHASFPRDLTSIVLSGSSRLLRENVDQHSAIRSAIERHEPEEARQRMVAHVRRAGELVTFRFERRDAP